MTASQAWRAIGEAFEQYAATGVHTELVTAANPGTCFGICFAIQKWPGISAEVRQSMRVVLWSELAASAGYWWPKTRKSADARAMYCYLLAAGSARVT